MDSILNPPSPDSNPSTQFERDRHVRFLEMMYQLLPSEYQGQEINRLTLAYFVVSGLHILGASDRVDKGGVINWVLSLQAHPKNEAELNDGQFYGFHGSRSSQFHSDDNAVWIPNGSHLASTYCALAILKTLGYDLSLLDSESILKSMKNLQQSDGSFMPIHTGAERDLRFVFCAAAICSMLENWSGMDKEKVNIEFQLTLPLRSHLLWQTQCNLALDSQLRTRTKPQNWPRLVILLLSLAKILSDCPSSTAHLESRSDRSSFDKIFLSENFVCTVMRCV